MYAEQQARSMHAAPPSSYTHNHPLSYGHNLPAVGSEGEVADLPHPACNGWLAAPAPDTHKLEADLAQLLSGGPQRTDDLYNLRSIEDELRLLQGKPVGQSSITLAGQQSVVTVACPEEDVLDALDHKLRQLASGVLPQPAAAQPAAQPRAQPAAQPEAPAPEAPAEVPAAKHAVAEVKHAVAEVKHAVAEVKHAAPALVVKKAEVAAATPVTQAAAQAQPATSSSDAQVVQSGGAISGEGWQGFEFGERVYQCLIGQPGVGYRYSPSFADKDLDGGGPVSPEVVIVDAICQGNSAVFVRSTSGRGWLPLTDPSGNVKCFAHLGKAEDVDLAAQGLVLTKGANTAAQ